MYNRDEAKDVFLHYAEQYDMQNILIRHKVGHTLRVAELSGRYAKELGMSAADEDFAWLLGLLHDIGRFEQARRYGTFVDSQSVDHAEFSADILFRDGLMERFPDEGLPEDWRIIAETAIRLHNKLTLPEDLDETARCFCDLIRDADKADIFRVVTELSFEERAGTSKGLLQETEGACDAVMDCVLGHRCVPRDARKNRFDVRVSHCCMAFELVYPESRKIVRQQGYLSRLVAGRNAAGEPLYSEKECGQMRIVRKEIEAAWGEPLEENEPGAVQG